MIEKGLSKELSVADMLQNGLLEFYQRQFTSSQATRERRKMYMEWKRAGLTPAIGEHWAKLIDPNPTRYNANDNWVVLNFFELIWVRLVVQLRAFNFPKEHIRRFADVMLSPNALIKEEAENMHKPNAENGELYIRLCQQLNRQPNQEEYKSYLEETVSQLKAISTFELFVIVAIKERKNLVFRATNEHGLIMYFLEDRSENTVNALNRMLSHPYLTISFSSLIDDFLFEEKNKQWKHKFQLLSEKEKKVLELIDNRNAKEITFHFKKETKEIHKATIKTEKNANVKSEGRQILEMMRSGKYRNLNISMINNNNVYIDRQETIKL